jgi:hypothetical protein
LRLDQTGEMVASRPMPMVNTKKPNRKSAILVIRPPKGREWGWRYCPPRRLFDTDADNKEKTVSDACAAVLPRALIELAFLKISA